MPIYSLYRVQYWLDKFAKPNISVEKLDVSSDVTGSSKSVKTNMGRLSNEVNYRLDEHL